MKKQFILDMITQWTKLVQGNVNNLYSPFALPSFYSWRIRQGEGLVCRSLLGKSGVNMCRYDQNFWMNVTPAKLLTVLRSGEKKFSSDRRLFVETSAIDQEDFDSATHWTMHTNSAIWVDICSSPISSELLRFVRNFDRSVWKYLNTS